MTEIKKSKAEAKRKNAALACAKKLEAASDSMNEYMRACLECDDASSPRRADDGRALLVERMMEFSCYLNAVFGGKNV